MKAKRELLHNQLIQEVIELARPHFSPKVPDIKQCIEHLIDKQYLDRVPGKDSYQYIA
jgi:hypothetical protein